MIDKFHYHLGIVAKVMMHIATKDIFITISFLTSVIDLVDAFYMGWHLVNI